MERVLGERATEALHRLIDRITVRWDAAMTVHRLELEGDLVVMLGKADTQKAPAYQRGAVLLQLVAGAGFGLWRTCLIVSPRTPLWEGCRTYVIAT
ncbi:hypothetical protein RAH32_09015 [Paracoccus sp. WLY502]|uniref:hypothetical protein n=1 Tax=Paracoccus yibinensis TaxID=3068891 RepID=UPI0027965128|nr:hypothetical protein [Paracoccus sp. WLY502]MDQ1900584.1 hypothetical protein [Paracoccus sp. WLY502]